MSNVERICMAVVALCLAALAWLAWFAGPAHAQTVCVTHQKMAELLKQRFDETPAVQALAGKDYMVELFASKKGTWTQVTTGKDDLSCIVGAGDSWEILAPQKPGDPT